MESQHSSAAPAPTLTHPDRWPPQIKYIVGNEAAERFSYYGVRSILAFYITGALMQDKDRAAVIIHMFVSLNYFMPLFGAWVSDRFWGRYHTILWVSLFYCAGHGVLALSDLFLSVDAKLACLYSGLGLIAFGSGGIKPCVSAFMGDQFGPHQGHLMRKAYSAFYFAINFGSFFSFLIIPWIAAKPASLAANADFVDRFLATLKGWGFTGYSWAFAVPGFAMAVATFVFWLGTKHYVRKPPTRETRTAGFFSVFLTAFRHLPKGNWELNSMALVSLLTCVILPLLAIAGMVYVGFRHDVTPTVKLIAKASLCCVGLWYLLVVVASLLKRAELPERFWAGAQGRFREAEITAARSVAPILAVLSLVPGFWVLYDQSTSTWVLQAKDMVPFEFLGFFHVAAEQMQSLNALLILILVPLLTWGLYPWLEKRGLQVTSLRRMCVGFSFTAVSFVVVGWLQARLEAQEPVSLAWQAVPYLLLTIGEVLISTTGLEFAYTQASPSMKGAIMSFFLLTVTVGNLIFTTITQLLSGTGGESVTSDRFYLYALIAAGVGVLFTVVAACYRYRDPRQTIG